MTSLESNPSKSAWLDELSLNEKVDTKLPQHLPNETDVLIIGGGMTGCSVAYWLNHFGVNSVLIEAREVAGGATGRNGGFLYAVPGRAEEKKCVEDLLEFIKHQNVECELFRCGLFSPKNREGLISKSVFDMDFFKYGKYDKNCYSFWPAKVCHGFLRCSPRCSVFSKVQVIKIVDSEIEHSHYKVDAITNYGKIHCKSVVIATNAYTVDLLPELKNIIYPVRNQIILTEPVNLKWPSSFSYGEGAEEIYAIQRRDQRIQIGGARAVSPNKEIGCSNDAELRKEITSALLNFLGENFPSLRNVKIQRQWSGIIGYTQDNIPLVGAVPSRSGIFIAAGFCGHGMSRCSLAGKTVVQMLLNKKITFSSYKQWSPSRFKLLYSKF